MDSDTDSIWRAKHLDVLENRERDEYNTMNSQRMIEVAHEYGIGAAMKDFRDVNPLSNYMNLSNWICVRGVVSNRPGKLNASVSYLKNHIIMNSAQVFHNDTVYDKYYQFLTLRTSGDLYRYVIPTYPVDTTNDILKLLDDKTLQLPILVKPEIGSQNEGIRILRTREAVSRGSLPLKPLVQPYIECDFEYRSYTIGGATYGISYSPNKTGNSDTPAYRDWNNLTEKSVIKEIKNIGPKATSLLGLEYSAIDVIRDKATQKLYILEVNAGPAIGMPTYCQNTGEDLKLEILRWFMERDKLIYQKLPLELCLRDYLEPRLKRLYKRTQSKVGAILLKEYEPQVDVTAENIANYYFDLSLEKKLEFIYHELKAGRQSELTNIVLGEAEKSVSWAGNFLVDIKFQNKNFVEPSTAHTLENGAVASAYYVAIKQMLEK